MTVSTDEFLTVKPEIPRGPYKRPYVVPLSGGKPITYQRTTTAVSGIEDTFKLGQWAQRHVAVGVAANGDLAEAVRQSDLNDKDGLNDLCDEAQNRSGARDSSRIGTWMHAVTEAADRGNPDPFSVPMPHLAFPRDKSEFAADLTAYLEATRHFKPVAIEQFCALDSLKIGGTPDRIVEYEGKRYILDLKTGNVEWGALKIASQLAVYSRSHAYDWQAAQALGDTATPDEAAALRTPHDADRDRGIVVHLPAGKGQCSVYWIDLNAGWAAAEICKRIRDQRKIPFRRLMQPLDTPAAEINLAKLITACRTSEAVRVLWRNHAAEWNDDLTEIAKAHISGLLV